MSCCGLTHKQKMLSVVTHTHNTNCKKYTQRCKLTRVTRSHLATVAQIRFMKLIILAHNIVNQIIGQFSFKRIKILDFSKSF